MAQYFLRNDDRLSFFVNYCIQGPFVKNKTAFIKMQHFLKRRFVAFGKNKGEVEAGAWYTLRCGIFMRRFTAFNGKKVMQEPLPFML